MKIKRICLPIALTISITKLYSSQQVPDDPIIVQHRGFNLAISNLQDTINESQSALKEMKETISSIPKLILKAEFITHAGIKAVGATFCIGGAKWMWDGANHLMIGYSPIETKQDIRKRLRKAKLTASQSAPQSSAASPQSKPEPDEYELLQREQSRQHINRGYIKLFAGLFSLGVGCLTMFKSNGIVNFFGGK